MFRPRLDGIMSLRCPSCGSTHLVWDEAYGYLICKECGTIIEQLIDESAGSANSALPIISLKPSNQIHALASLRRAHSLWESDNLNKNNLKNKNNKMLVNEIHGCNGCNQNVPENDELVSVLAKSALRIIEYSREFSSRHSKTKLAIAYYIAALAIGMTKAQALSLASLRANVPEKYLAKILRPLGTHVYRVLSRLGESYAGKTNRRAERAG